MKPISDITKEMMGETWNSTSITYRDIRKNSTLFPIITKMNKLYGAGNWGIDELGQDILERRSKTPDKKTPRVVVKAKEVYKDTNRSIEQRVDAYISNFEGVTQNDIQTFRQMAVLEQQMVEIETRLLDKGLIPAELKTLGELYTKLSGEFRQLQSILGIDRSSRETQVDTAEALKRYVHGADELLKKHAVEIRCPKCVAKEVVINQGYIMFHFRNDVTWTWTSRCPQCGEMLVLGKEVEYAESSSGVETGEPSEPRIDEPFDLPVGERRSLPSGVQSSGEILPEAGGGGDGALPEI
jgi:hypothetical protein